MKPVLFSIAFLLPAIVLVSCAGRSETAGPAPAQAALVVPAAKAARADLATSVVLTAEFEPYQEVDVMAKVSGYVRSIGVDIGDRVREGQVLATLEVPEMKDEISKAAAAIAQADADSATAADEVRRAESLFRLAHLSYSRIVEVARKETGLVPQQEVDEAASRDQEAEAQIAAARSGVKSAEQRARVARAEEARLKTWFQYTSITAPFDGVVTKRYANVGSMIQAGTASQAMPVVRVSQNNRLRLVLPVPESSVPRVRVGQLVDVRVPSMGRTFPGRVARFAEKVQESTRTMDTQVDVANPSLALVPGLYAEVDLRTAQRDRVLAVPLDAVEGTGSSARVYTVAEPGVIRIVPVSLGLETAQQVEIHSGLAEGDVVVVGRLAGLRDGQKVQARIEEK